MKTSTDVDYLKRTIRLARKGIGYVNPNPLVGAVIVREGEVVAEGYHHFFGKEHAEVMAINQAGDKARGATLYINLEPCCHYGKTPPCTDIIVKAGLKRVVIGMVDPNPLVGGRGIEALKQHKIEVSVGVEEQACKELNQVFIKYITTGLPYVTMKIAQSLDGRIATRTGNSQWITSYKSRIAVHRLRREQDAIIVGIGTVLKDNPQLTVRHVRGKNPRRIVLDSHLQTPLTSHLLTDKFADRTIIATTSVDFFKINSIQQTGATVWQLDATENSRISIPKLLKKIANAQMSAVMVEGGSKVNTTFLKEKMVDRLFMILAPKILGTGIEAIGDLNTLSVEQGIRLQNMKTKKIDQDLFVIADLIYN